MNKLMPLSALVFDPTIYPRQNINSAHVAEFKLVMETGETLPPIVAERKSGRIVDGVHRFHAYAQIGAQKIAVDLRDYTSEAELFKEAVLLNTAHGLNLDTYDRLKVITIGDALGLKDLDLSIILRTPVTQIVSLRPRFATVQEIVDGTMESRRTALKTSTRHLAGETITAEQERAIQSAPGQSYLLTVRQLKDALTYGLLPSREKHPMLWDELENLGEAIREVTAVAL